MNYLAYSWTEFHNLRKNYNEWRTRKVTVTSPKKTEGSAEAAKWLMADPPKIEVKLNLDANESKSDLEIDPSEW